MILDVVQKEGQSVKYISPFKLLQTKIQDAVQRRANAAFEGLQFTRKGLEELEQTLGICEKLVNDLRYVYKYVRPCFPEEIKVFELFSESYESIFQKKIDYFLLDMEPMVQKEPQSVLAFNKFVSMTKDVMREFNFEIMAVFKIENGLKDLFPKYM